MESSGPDDRARPLILLASHARRFLCGSKSPLGMQELCIRREITFRWITAHKCPDFYRNARVGLIMNQAACRENGVIQVGRKINPSHELNLTTRIFKGARF